MRGSRDFFVYNGYIILISGLKGKRKAMEFRFQKLENRKDSIKISKTSYLVVEELREHKHFSIADQFMRATLSISNNIAEGSGSATKKDFANFLNISRRSIFECANIIIILYEIGIIEQKEMDQFLSDYQNLSAKIYYFRNRLLE